MTLQEWMDEQGITPSDLEVTGDWVDSDGLLRFSLRTTNKAGATKESLIPDSVPASCLTAKQIMNLHKEPVTIVKAIAPFGPEIGDAAKRMAEAMIERFSPPRAPSPPETPDPGTNVISCSCGVDTTGGQHYWYCPKYDPDDRY